MRSRPLWRSRFLPLLEALEERMLLSASVGGGSNTFLVSNTNDSGDGSLRQAILNADSANGPSTIQFSISSDSTASKIQILSALPTVTQQTLIDGWTEPNYADAPLIVLDGTQLPQGSAIDGLTISASNVTVRGLAIDNFTGNGIVVNNAAPSVTLESLFIGVDGQGNAAGNAGDGILLTAQVQHANIGTTSNANIIAANHGNGIRLDGLDTKRNLLVNNYIGLTLAPGSSSIDGGSPTLQAAGNQGDGILLGHFTSANQVAGNVIGANTGNGLELNFSWFNLIVANNIGTDNQADDFGNGGDGVLIGGNSRFNRLGGSVAYLPSNPNVITANKGNGVHITGVGTSQNVLDGNVIGTLTNPVVASSPSPSDFTPPNEFIANTQTFQLPTQTSGNAGDGVLVDGGATYNLVGVGPSTAGDIVGINPPIISSGNTINYNQGQGVEIAGAGTANTVVAGNLIGVDTSQTAAVGNSFANSSPGNGKNGVLVGSGADSTTIGGTASGTGNTIANEPLNGVALGGTGTTAVLGNSIYGNANLGIDRTQPAGPDTNTPNGATNYPVLTAATLDAGNENSNRATISGSLNSVPNTSVRIDFFYNASADPSGYGQGATYLGSAVGQTNANGNWIFSVDFAVPASSGVISATATANGNTSEFSKDLTIGDAATLQVISGIRQSAFMNTAFAAPLAVQAMLDGQPLVGAVIAFAAPTGNQPGGFFQILTGSQTTYQSTAEGLTDANGNASFAFIANSYAGNDTVTAALQGAAASPGLFTLTNKPILLQIGGFPSPQGAGVPGSYTVMVVDPANPTNAIANYQGTVTFASSDGNATFAMTSYTFAASDHGARSFTVSLRALGSQSLMVTDATNPVLTATQNSISVIPGPAASFDVTEFPATVTAGDHDTFTVVARDQFGNVATGYTGTVTFKVNDPQAVQTLTHTFTTGDAGIFSFQDQLKTAGPRTVSLDDGNLSKTTSVTVQAAQATQLDVSGASQVQAGSNDTFTITAHDPYGNVDPNYAGTVVVNSTDPKAQLSESSFTFTPQDQGQHQVQVTFETAGPQSLTPAPDANHPLTVNPKAADVTPADVKSLEIDGFPTANSVPTVNAGQAFTFVVSARDSFGNLVPGYAGTVTVSTSDFNASLPPPATFNPGVDQGSHSFTVTLNRAGPQTFLVGDGNGHSASFNLVNVQDTLTHTNKLLIPSQNTSFTAVVAHFDDTALTDPSQLAQYAPTIDWGDGTTNDQTGQIVAAAGGGFDVKGTHKYGTDATFTIHVSIANSFRGTADAVDSSAVVLTGDQNAALTSKSFTLIPPSTGDIKTPFQTDRVSGVLDQPTGNTQMSSVFVGVYANNPQPGTNLNGVFFELKGGNLAPDATMTLTFSYANLDSTSVHLLYFNVADNQYEEVPQNEFVNDTNAKTLTLTLNATSTPKLSQVVHTVFTITLLPPAPPPTQVTQVTQVTPAVAEVNTNPSVLGQSLTRSDSANNRTASFEADFQTSGPTLTLAPSADRATSTGTSSSAGGGDDQRPDLDKLTAAAESAALRGLNGVVDGLLNGVPTDDGDKAPPKKEDKQPEEEETATFDLTLSESAKETPVRLRTLDAMFAEGRDEDADLPAGMIDFSFVEQEADEREPSSAIWAAAGLIAGVTVSRWQNREEEEEDLLCACAAEDSN